jgi:hypothetical protein
LHHYSFTNNFKKVNNSVELSARNLEVENDFLRLGSYIGLLLGNHASTYNYLDKFFPN